MRWWFAPSLVLALVGCKKDKPSPDKAPAGDPVVAKTTPPAKVPVPDAEEAADDPDPPALPAGCAGFTAYASGSAKMEASGAETATIEFPELSSASGGTSMAEGIVLGFRSASGNEKLAFEIPCAAGTSKGGISNLQLEAGTYLAGECTIDLKKHDQSGLEGTLDCPSLTNFNDHAKTIKFTGAFTATR